MSKTPKISDIKIAEKDWMPDGKFALVSPNTESDKSIDEILNQLHYENLAHINGSHGSDDSHVKSAKSQLYSLLMDVIGEIETEPDKRARNADMRRDGRNQLRAEQRQKLNQLFNKEK